MFPDSKAMSIRLTVEAAGGAVVVLTAAEITFRVTWRERARELYR
jgi:hypothetical protein